MQGPPLRTDLPLIFAFLAMVLTPLSVFVASDTAASSTSENRALRRFPDFPHSLAELERYPSAVTEYWDDHFGLRAEMTWLYSNVLYRALGTVPFGKVRIHPDGWVFEDIANYRGCESLIKPAEEVEQSASRMMDTARTLANRGVHYVVLLVPNKNFVHRPEAPGLACPPDRTTGHQLRQALQARGATFPVIDAFDALVQARDGARLYYQTDPHWNDRGAFIGYQLLMQQLTRWYPTLHPLALSDFREVPRRHRGGSLARMANLSLDEEATYLEHRRPRRARRIGDVHESAHDPWAYDRSPITYETDAQELPRVLVFRDSYSRQLRSWLPEHFSRTTFLWARSEPAALARYPAEIVVEQKSY